MDLRSRDARYPVLHELDAHMGAHHGLIDLATATALGATRALIRERVASSAWVEVHSKVYRSASAPRGPEQSLLAAILASGRTAVASHRSAAWSWRLLARAPDIPEVTVTVARAPQHPGIRLYRSKDLVGSGASLRSGIPVTAPARTIFDASGVVPAHVTALMIDRAIASKLLTVPALVTALEQFGRRGRRGTAALRAALEARGVSAPGRAPSVLESAMARLLKQLDIAPPVPEYEVAGGRFRFDFAWPDILFAIEVQGWLAHTAFSDWSRDIRKRNWADDNGWEVYEVTWDDVTKRPEAVATEILRRIRRRTLVAPEV